MENLYLNYPRKRMSTINANDTESLGDYTFPFLVIHETAYAFQRPEVPGGEE